LYCILEIYRWRKMLLEMSFVWWCYCTWWNNMFYLSNWFWS
jgi:hypothetical protein